MAKASKKISQRKLTEGLDLGDRSSWYCMDESGAIVPEQRLCGLDQSLAAHALLPVGSVREGGFAPGFFG